ncbi:hypothetical protein LXL04_022909 [Taraxacum kok-saghyz]
MILVNLFLGINSSVPELSKSVPLRLWGAENFEAILRRYGKIVAPFDDLESRVDLSSVKIGILSPIKQKLNDILHITASGKTYEIGIMECEEDRCPFKFDPIGNCWEGSGSESQKDEDEEDGFSDT